MKVNAGRAVALPGLLCKKCSVSNGYGTWPPRARMSAGKAHERCEVALSFASEFMNAWGYDVWCHAGLVMVDAAGARASDI